MKIFFDTEFTGLHQKTTLISIGLVAENGRTFYAEFTDYDKSQVDEWIQENVISNLALDWYDIEHDYAPGDYHVEIKGETLIVKIALLHWLGGLVQEGEQLIFWGDCLSYDWMLFCELFGGALNLPDYIYYIPFDLSTLFATEGVDPDFNREELAGLSSEQKHNALWDAKVIRECYERLTNGTL